MYTHIDWISFSVLIEDRKNRTEKETLNDVGKALFDLADDMDVLLGMDRGMKFGAGRRPYSASVTLLETGATIFYHPKLNHALVEIPGSACEQYIAAGYLDFILEAARYRVTRVDVAVDMEVATTPKEFTDARSHQRMRNGSEWNEDSGKSVYVGSYKSDRFARVYRYNPPHERAHLLRSEFVLKGNLAKLAAQEIIEKGLNWYAAALGNAFGWSHSDWKPDAMTDAKPATYKSDRPQGKTLFWLADTVAPLLARLHKEGAIDIIEWVETNVLPKINPPDAQPLA